MLIDAKQTTCLNEALKHEWQSALDKGVPEWLESDVDEQLLLNIRFSSSRIQIHSIVIESNDLCNYSLTRCF